VDELELTQVAEDTHNQAPPDNHLLGGDLVYLQQRNWRNRDV
jgi:hypothetical protein